MATSQKTQVNKSGLPDIKPGEYIFELTQKIAPRFKDAPPYPPKKSLPPMINAFDEATNTVRSLRAIPGVKELWVDDQRDKKINEDWALNNAWRAEFIDGKLILNAPQDTVKIQRLFMDDGFDGKTLKADRNAPIVFTMINEVKDSEDYLAKGKEKKTATDRAMAAIEEGLYAYEAHARFLLIPFDDKGIARTEAQIAADYYRKAETDPVEFNKHYKSPLIDIQNLIVKGIQKGIIDTTSSRGEAKWKENGATICEVDLTKKPVDALVAFATSEPGKKFIERLEQLLK
jgi:hypothetical protein